MGHGCKPGHLQAVDKPHLETSLQAGVRQVSGSRALQVTPNCTMERAKKSLFDSDVASKLESSFGSGTGVWVKASFAYTARTICLRLPYIIR